MPKGFGSLTPERRREISAAGGKAAHARGTAHRFSHAEAVAAGRIGGLKARKRDLALAALEASKPLESEVYQSPPTVILTVAVTPTEPPPPAPPTEPAPPLVVEETTVGPAHPDFDPQAALDAAEIQRVHDEAMARS